MATRAYSWIETPYDAHGVRLIQWTGLLNGDDGTPFLGAPFNDRSIQVLGTFGVGGTLVMEGANAMLSPTWHGLADPQGNALSFTSGRTEAVLEVTTQIRPRVTAGDGTTTLTVLMLVVQTGR